MFEIIVVSLLAVVVIGFRIEKVLNNIKLTWWDHLALAICLVWFYFVFLWAFEAPPQ
ncbi:hypothetical protein ZC03_057 [Pseudomonas phage ZC03]|uniref:Uncharacterized protein n=2 Tax=Zicotriavirus TaxID=2843161 RepID=A0A1L2C951_9CAUD|nr:hypothetical protein HWA93_gp72 [Pseudomonas phage ZC03]YP_009830613.1 hypothetical protein HWA94_gp75 [Pseudomonas phage ZC08]AMD43434.1 hypothetical protein ZC03_057 [Pseudomonas phage ZC03]AMD43514.1 hypothetical protein ZC08_051 [Pseudomonas phage ZC08]